MNSGAKRMYVCARYLPIALGLGEEMTFVIAMGSLRIESYARGR